MRSLVSNSIYAKRDRNGLPVPTKLLLKTSPDAAMLFAPFGCAHPPPPVPPFLLLQNLSPFSHIIRLHVKVVQVVICISNIENLYWLQAREKPVLISDGNDTPTRGYHKNTL